MTDNILENIPKKQNAIEVRKSREKDLLIEQLKKTPIVQVACEKIGVSRATFYRWKNEDEDFAGKADQAITEGGRLINDFAESQLISAIKNGQLSAIVYWLNHHHKTYANKLEISGKIETKSDKLTPEQEQVVRRALELTALSEPIINNLTDKNKIYDNEQKFTRPESSEGKPATDPSEADGSVK